MKIALLTSTLIFLCMQGYAEDSKILSKINKAGEKYNAAQEAASLEYRKDFNDAIAGATQIEIYLLSEPQPSSEPNTVAKIPSLPEDQLFDIPQHLTSIILKRKKLSLEEVSLLMPILLTTIETAGPDGGALCHHPIHGLRIWDESEVIFQTTICYECNNFIMPNPYGYNSFISLNNSTFQTIMEQLMPIPAKPKK